jgi:hypothetical protein
VPTTSSTTAPGQRPMSAIQGSATTQRDIEYRLFRVFDYSVKPAKKYRYRVKVALRNPNYGMPSKWLKKPDPNALDYLTTDWSSPSSTVAIPDRFGVLAKGVTKDSRNSDPTVGIVVTAIDEATGLEAAVELDVQRGSLANTVRDRADAVDPRDRTIQELKDVDFRTGILVLDIRGGKPFSKRSSASLTGPADVLILDPQGNLRVRNELDDQPLVEARIPVEQPKPTAKADPIPTAKSRAPVTKRRER